MYDEPYLETCCRSALHRLILAGPIGRPPGLKDGPCLERLDGDGLARRRPDGQYEPTEQGVSRHASEIGTQAEPAVVLREAETTPAATKNPELIPGSD